jgi:hypothetical protein
MGDLSENFSQSEFSCGCPDPDCSGKQPPDQELIQGLQWLRHEAGEPVNTTKRKGKNGGNRCKALNSQCGGAPKSQHRYNKAGDVYCDGKTGPELALLACRVEAFRNGGIGVAKNHIHVDVRKSTRGVVWIYSTAKGDISERTIDKEKNKWR